MKVFNLQQGTPEWMAHRAKTRNASDAPAVLGCSPFMDRNTLLHVMHTGIRPEPTPAEQDRFARGHEIERLKRPVGEAIVGDDLFPVVGSEVLSDQVFGAYALELSASFDGLTMDQGTNWECKTLNDDVRAALPNPGPDGNDAANLPKHYRVQMQQQCMVAGCARVLFTASDGENDDRHCWFYPDADLAREIMAGWRQFDVDLAAYTPRESAPAAVAAPIESLPAVSVQMQGSLAVVSNLDVFGTMLRAFVEKIPKKPTTDQEFADADAAVKALKKAEEALDAAEANALGQVKTVEELTRTIGDLRNVARTARLATEKLVKARKEAIRTEEVQRGKEALTAHVVALDKSLGRPLMPPIVADFAGAISGKKTLDSLRNAIDTELARAKIAANETAERIRGNLKLLDAQPEHLFRDINILAQKAPDDLAAIIAARLAEEERRQNAERERIRREEQERADREARERVEAEQKAAQAAAPSAPAQPPAAAPIASPATVSQAQNVRPLVRPTPAPATPPSLKLGEISSRLGFAVTADFLKSLGFEPAARDRSALLFHESQFPEILDAIDRHIEAVRQQYARQAA